MDLGIKVLHLPECKINAALYDHSNSIQAATHELLSTWLRRQISRQEAYTNLYSDLRKGEMKQLAGLVKRMVEGLVDTSPVTDESKYRSKIINTYFHLKLRFFYLQLRG